MLPMFLAVVDQTIVATALPAIAGATGEVERVSWIVVGYLIASTIAAPIYGRLGDVFGRRRLMFVALGIFIAASLLCAASPTIELLTAARVLQGLGGGGLMTLSQALVGEVDPAARARALPGLSRGGGGFRQYFRAGRRRLSHATFRLGIDLPDQPADRPRGHRPDHAIAAPASRTMGSGGGPTPTAWCCSR